MINKSASLIGTIVFKNCNQNTLHVGANRSTGQMIVWQQAVIAGKQQRSKRATGRNLVALVEELQHVLNEGHAGWHGPVNHAALDALAAEAKKIAKEQ